MLPDIKFTSKIEENKSISFLDIKIKRVNDIFSTNIYRKVKLSFCHLKVVFQSPYKLHTLFRFKDTLDKKIPSDLVCRYSCSTCNATYYGKT